MEKKDTFFTTENTFDWKEINSKMKPSDNLLQLIMDEIPKGLTYHLKAKKRIGDELNVTIG